jgi:transposase
VFEILAARGFQVILVNARHVKNLPGRKSDVSDCEWLRDLHILGLVRGSFRPADGFVALRGYLRHRATLIECAGALVQRMQKALVQMNGTNGYDWEQSQESADHEKGSSLFAGIA